MGLDNRFHSAIIPFIREYPFGLLDWSWELGGALKTIEMLELMIVWCSAFPASLFIMWDSAMKLWLIMLVPSLCLLQIVPVCFELSDPVGLTKHSFDKVCLLSELHFTAILKIVYISGYWFRLFCKKVKSDQVKFFKKPLEDGALLHDHRRTRAGNNQCQRGAE